MADEADERARRREERRRRREAEKAGEAPAEEGDEAPEEAPAEEAPAEEAPAEEAPAEEAPAEEAPVEETPAEEPPAEEAPAEEEPAEVPAPEPEPVAEPEPTPPPPEEKKQEKKPQPVPEIAPVVRQETDAEREMREMQEKRKQEQDVMLAEAIEQLRKDREALAAELTALRERREKRKIERKERDRLALEREEAKRKKAEEEALRRKEEMEARKTAAQNKRRAREQTRQMQFQGIGQHLGGSDIKGAIQKAKASTKSAVEKEEEKQKVMAERIPNLMIGAMTSPERLREYANDFKGKLSECLGAIYDMTQKQKRQKYDIHELTERFKDMQKNPKKDVAKLMASTDKKSKFTEELQAEPVHKERPVIRGGNVKGTLDKIMTAGGEEEE
ncbi:uncharacterized protein LOC100371934 isoform X10 [Saccoglossus kowalevskii]|uniref:Troponin T, slow skeletal muscle-like isoform X21 n=1 Tax=Saccoglossus kowalevskii TaxID=10224 RepID=A0ABM0MMW1_SACKO|nr:PREDICTED: troponin T, slow skeletal muscle-like isoform X21 [Saccoglossus kowalevskii]XP_006821352.1 PREDICTED: troponin T, slow skeletal muscle-like isoform X22 [Saccoglossus kowalevskii]XP_006821353.1 PREDICTED: troponin T, slow skeletal muscle-like isoform X23 [Saccoglossus kowalevskii]